jgi:flagellar basal-body rod modification protein FlgD
MSVGSATSSSASSALNSSSTGFNAQIGFQQFFQLLIAQLQNQDPSQPMSSTDFINELAQLSSLSGIQQVNTNFSTLLSQQMLTGGTSLLGQTVSYTNPSNNAQASGTVTAVGENQGAGQVTINNTAVPIANVLNVQ